jgi:copper resistance protein C
MKTSLLKSIAPRSLVCALTLGAAQLAFAHAYPTHQAPGAGATVPASQKDVAIDFDDGLEPAFSSITVTDAQGNAVTAGKAVVDASNNKHMSVALSPLKPGVYTVAWVAVASDGHRTQGHYTFTVKP